MQREIETSTDIGNAWENALFQIDTPGVTRDAEGNISMPDEVRVVFRELFIKMMNRYLHVWQGEFLRKFKYIIALKAEDSLRTKIKNTVKSRTLTGIAVDKIPVPRPPSRIMPLEDSED